MKYIFIIILLACLGSSFSNCKEEIQLPKLSSPQEISNWLFENFEYVLEIGDNWQTVEETIKLGYGDCEDFAILTTALLENIGIKSEMVIIYFRGIKTGHVLCYWKDEGGIVNFISNRELKYTRKNSLTEAIMRYYPDCVSISIMSKDLKKVKSSWSTR